MIRALAAADRAGKLPQTLKSFTTRSQLLVIKVAVIVEALHTRDARVEYLPPYSPDGT